MIERISPFFPLNTKNSFISFCKNGLYHCMDFLRFIDKYLLNDVTRNNFRGYEIGLIFLYCEKYMKHLVYLYVYTSFISVEI